jgi:hypothetical protein
MKRKRAETTLYVMWQKRLEACNTNLMYFKDSFVPEMRDCIQVDVRRYA